MEWFQTNYLFDWFLEIKATKTNTVPQSAVSLHQLKALKAIRSKKGFKHKLSDAGRVRQPFDCFGVREKHSFVVACFIKHGYCLAIHPSKWEGARYDSECEFRITI